MTTKVADRGLARRGLTLVFQASKNTPRMTLARKKGYLETALKKSSTV
jgi:hypothetical protein